MESQDFVRDCVFTQIDLGEIICATTGKKSDRLYDRIAISRHFSRQVQICEPAGAPAGCADPPITINDALDCFEITLFLWDDEKVRFCNNSSSSQSRKDNRYIKIGRGYLFLRRTHNLTHD